MPCPFHALEYARLLALLLALIYRFHRDEIQNRERFSSLCLKRACHNSRSRLSILLKRTLYIHVLKKKKPTHTKRGFQLNPQKRRIKPRLKLPTITIKGSRCFCNLKRRFALVLFFVPEMMLVTVDLKKNIRTSAILILFQTLYKLKQGTVFSFATNVIPNIKDSGLMQHMMLSLPL